MDFEIIDESEVVYSRRGREKKKPTLFDTPLIERNFWGNDKGTELAMHLARSAIRRYAKRNIIFDVDDHDLTRKLNQEFREELKQYQQIISS